MPTNVALYYPYVHFRDESWLKVAALYWPRLARIVPHGYPTHDSTSVQMLRDELDAIVDLPPDMGALMAVGDRFLRLVNEHPDALKRKCDLQGLHTAVDPAREARLGRPVNPLYADGSVAFVYASKTTYDRFVIAALRQVVPSNLSAVPMERIVAARKDAGHLLNGFREYVEEQVGSLAAAHASGDAPLAADILAEVELTVASKLHVLERDLRKARLDVVPSLFSIKTALPALPLAAANAAHMPATVQGGVAVAAGVAWVARGMSTATTQVVEDSPVGYLHSVRTSLKADTKVRKLVRSVWG